MPTSAPVWRRRKKPCRAIRHGEVDALVVSGPEGDRVFTLKGADHTYRILVETINEGAATMAADGKIIYANRRLAEMLKLPLEQVINSTICGYVDPPDRELFEALFSTGKQGASKGEVHLRAADGSLVPAYLSLSSMHLEALPDMVCLAATDLTEQKRQEETVAAGRLARAILEQAEHAIVVCDAHGIITQASQAVHHLFSGNPLLRRFEEVFPLRIGSQQSVVDFPSEKAFFLAPILQGKVYRDVEACYRCQDGRNYHLLLDAGPIADENGTVLGCVVVLTDITRRKRREVERQKLLEHQQALTEELASTNEELEAQAEEMIVQKKQLERLNADLKTANEEMKSFSYSVSHDLRAPLRGIDGWSLAFLEDYGDGLDDQGRNYLDWVRAETQRMGQLIDDMLSLSRVGRAELRREPVDLSALAQGIAAKLRQTEPERQAEFIIQPGLAATGDPPLLELALFNLLDNAWKFTGKQPAAVIEFGRMEQDGRPVFFLRDNGTGFDMAYASKLFGPFQRLHQDLGISGHGHRPGHRAAHHSTATAAASGRRRPWIKGRRFTLPWRRRHEGQDHPVGGGQSQRYRSD